MDQGQHLYTEFDMRKLVMLDILGSAARRLEISHGKSGLPAVPLTLGVRELSGADELLKRVAGLAGLFILFDEPNRMLSIKAELSDDEIVDCLLASCHEIE
jgi:hypothetical protein